MKHLMLDLETLGNKSYSVILSISAVAFDMKTGETFEEFHMDLDFADQLKKGAIVNADTILWWLTQSDDARKMVTDAKRKSTNHVLRQFNTWLSYTFNKDAYKSDEISLKEVISWGNSNSFDQGILENLYELFEIKNYLVHWNERDVRTLVSFSPEIKKNEIFDGVKHYGIDDCKHQIKYCSKIVNKYNIEM